MYAETTARWYGWLFSYLFFSISLAYIYTWLLEGLEHKYFMGALVFFAGAFCTSPPGFRKLEREFYEKSGHKEFKKQQMIVNHKVAILFFSIGGYLFYQMLPAFAE